MKKCLCVLLAAGTVLTTAACGGTAKTDGAKTTAAAGASVTAAPAASATPVDVDLTVLNATMVYSQMYDMLSNPDKYVGKTVKMKGTFALYENQDKTAQYFACVIADATACCSQGLEFILKDKKTYPDDYPKLGTQITVTGTFQTYTEGNQQYCHLIDGTLVS